MSTIVEKEAHVANRHSDLLPNKKKETRSSRPPILRPSDLSPNRTKRTRSSHPPVPQDGVLSSDGDELSQCASDGDLKTLQSRQSDDQILSELEQQYDKNIRPLLDMVDKLRTLGIMDEGIQLPSIVVVGDQSSGKSSVLESLASISLPRGQGIATRVPLVLRLQRCPPGEVAAITIEYEKTKEQISEEAIKSAVDRATIVLAGDKKGVSDTPISLHIRKPNAPDLTMIDLPGITRVPVHGQPENIYEQISAMIHRYIQPKECVILNVLSATVDFSTCESIRMSQKEDKAGDRTLAVVTKVDRACDGLYEKVTVDAVNIGLGYVCVRNRANEEESHEDARAAERILFETHPALSKLDKDMVGIGSLAERLTAIQANIIRRSLPGIVKKIERALLDRQKELRSLPEGLGSQLAAEGMFMKIMVEKRLALEKLVSQGNIEGFSDDVEMHYAARLDELFQQFSDTLHSSGSKLKSRQKTEEILKLMREGRGVYLPNFLNGAVFQSLVRSQIESITVLCQQLVASIHKYVEKTVFTVTDQYVGAFTTLRSSYRRSAEKVLAQTRDGCLVFVNRELEKESAMVHTMNDYYMANVRKIQDQVSKLTEPASTSTHTSVPAVSFGVGNPFGSVQPTAQLGSTEKGSGVFSFGNTARGTGVVGIIPVSSLSVEAETEQFPYDELKHGSHCSDKIASNGYQSALDMKVSLIAYWKVVHKRLADGLTFELRYAFRRAIVNDLDKDVLKEKASKGVSYLMNEDPTTIKKRKRLQQSVDVLQESYGIVSDLLRW